MWPQRRQWWRRVRKVKAGRVQEGSSQVEEEESGCEDALVLYWERS